MRSRMVKMAPNAKLGSLDDACARYGFGRNKMRQIAENAGAVVKIGRCVRLNFAVLDKYFDEITG